MHFIEPDWPAPAGVFALSTTRQGGSSLPPFDSFNLAQHVADDPALVAANRALLARALPAESQVHWLHQVHGVRVVQAGQGAVCPEADASWSEQAGAVCAVMTADCLPVLFCSRSGDRVAAAHAGWRGLLGGVLEATLEALAAPPGEMLAWLGPAIGPAAFEVGAEVRDAFLAAQGADQQADHQAIEHCFQPSTARAGHYFADLYALARTRLTDAGITAIYGGDYCTYSDSQRFFSYRRDGQTGRMASLIMLRPA